MGSLYCVLGQDTTLMVSLSTQEYKWVLDKHPILWEKQCLELLHATESRMIKRWLNELLG